MGPLRIKSYNRQEYGQKMVSNKGFWMTCWTAFSLSLVVQDIEAHSACHQCSTVMLESVVKELSPCSFEDAEVPFFEKLEIRCSISRSCI